MTAMAASNWSETVLRDKDTFRTFAGLMPEVGATWLLSLNPDDYRGVDSHRMRWPVRETLVLKANDGDAPDVMLEIEGLQYTYESGFEGPVVAYPARGDGGPAAALSSCHGIGESLTVGLPWCGLGVGNRALPEKEHVLTAPGGQGSSKRKLPTAIWTLLKVRGWTGDGGMWTLADFVGGTV